MTTDHPSPGLCHILVVDPDPGFAQQIREALEHPDWHIHLVEDRAAARARADQQPPNLVLVDVGLPGASDLLGAFARRPGGPDAGPGSMALVPAAIYGRVQAADYHADDLLPKPFSIDELRRRVTEWFASAVAVPQPDEVPAPLSSDDLFGDILAEVEATMEPEPSHGSRPVFDDDLEKKLERTLSGVLDVDRPRRPAAPAAPASATTAGAPKAAMGSRSDIDLLLDQTLGNLAQSGKRRRDRKNLAAGSAKPTAPQAPLVTTPGTPGGEPAPLSANDPPVATTPAVSVLDGNPDHFATRKIPTLPNLPLPEPPAEVPEASAADLSTGESRGERFGEYALLERIAVGGMAEVWRARRTGVEGFQKTLAIKKILSHLTDSPDVVTMLVDEAKLAAQLSHDNIIQIYDLGKVDDDFFIAMELVEGMDLRSILAAARARDMPIPIGQALWIAARLAHALDHAHRKQGFDGRDLGIVHRDVSPQNVLIGHEGEIKLCDFGIARAVSRVGNTQMGALKGKLQYMSPEQAWARDVDSRTDIFSLGSVLFEMLTGIKLFAGDSEISILDAVRDCHIPTPSALRAEIPAVAEAIVLRALAKDPADRYQRAGDMAADLGDVLRTLDPQPTPTTLAAFVARLNAASVPAATSAEPLASETHGDTRAPATIPPSAPPSTPPLAAASDVDTTPDVPTDAPVQRDARIEVPEVPAAGRPAIAVPAVVADTVPEPAETSVDARAVTSASEGDIPEVEVAKGDIPEGDIPESQVPDDDDGPSSEAAYDLLADEGTKPHRGWLPWFAIGLLLVALVAAWYVFLRTEPGAATPAPAATAPAATAMPPAALPIPTATTTEGEPASMEPADGAPLDGAAVATPTATENETENDAGAGDLGQEDTAAPTLDPSIERMVAEELERRTEKLRNDFERERKELEDELNKAQDAADDAVDGEDAADGNNDTAEPTPPPPPPIR